jgi:hydrogenase maturation protein HypF
VTVRVRLDITGVVQGVGFRPAVARIAADFGLTGWVYNDAGSVHCELEGPAGDVDAAVAALRDRPPPMARIDSLDRRAVELLGTPGFVIVDSHDDDGSRTLVPPDIAACADCLFEMRDPADRRFGHPFITCTNCGPRYTVITDLPYDRPVTTMAGFPMCDACRSEYTDPADRRYHAQTIACADCGPRLSWRGPAGEADDAVGAAVAALLAGQVVAIKGIGGFHLACRADDDGVVNSLRKRKNRPAKPFAVMVADLDAARAVVEVSGQGAAALSSPAAPIVLLPRSGDVVAESVAPGLADLGVMLAYSPVHHQIFDRLGGLPLVMTSANRGGSPIVFRDRDLSWIVGSADGRGTPDLADAVLTHDRPIGVPCEDSVVAVDDEGRELPLRRSRGYAPLPVAADLPAGDTLLATGGDLKTTFCLMAGDVRAGRRHAHLSSHLGDMADPRTQVCFESALDHLAFMTGQHAAAIACDMHPGYATTAWARRSAAGRPVIAVQHHHAHAVSLLADHQRLGTPIVAVTYDGTGYGADGTIWGGELLAVTDPAEFTRMGHLVPFALPGGAYRPGPADPGWHRMVRGPAAGGRGGPGRPARAGPADPARARLRSDVQHGPVVRRRRQPARGLPGGQLRGSGCGGTRAPGPSGRCGRPGRPGLRRHRRAAGSGAGDRRDRRRTAGRGRIRGSGRRVPRRGGPGDRPGGPALCRFGGDLDGRTDRRGVCQSHTATWASAISDQQRL